MRTGMLILCAAVIVAAVLVAGQLYLSPASFNPANPSWDGLSALAMGNDARPLYDFSQLQQAGPGGTLTIAGPSANYTVEDAREASEFMLQGGRVVIMDDYGTSNGLLRNLSVPIRINSVPLCQDMDYYKKPALPVIKDIANESIAANVHALTLNHAVPLDVSGGAEVLARTSDNAWLDLNDNGKMDGTEVFGIYPVMARYGYGQGELIVAGDADLVINSMLDKSDNGVLQSNIAGHGPVYVDVAHGQQLPPLASLYYIVKYNLAAQIICALLIILAGYAFSIRGRLLKGGDMEPEKADAKRPLMAIMKKLPLSQREIEELNKKL